MKPQFIIICGPNGSGKSVFGHFHVPNGTPIFNGDLVFAELKIQYSHIEPERLAGGVAVALEKARDAALAGKTNFAFESNFSNDMAIEISKTFSDAGYETSIVYFGLNDLESSALRVDTRVLLGGHDMPLEIIRFNMEEGIKRVIANLPMFDKISFVDTSIKDEAPIIAYFIKDTGAYAVLKEDLQWFNANFREPLYKLALKQAANLEKQKNDIKEIEPDNEEGNDWRIGR
jgi:predicted ABC-type ATPase